MKAAALLALAAATTMLGSGQTIEDAGPVPRGNRPASMGLVGGSRRGGYGAPLAINQRQRRKMARQVRR